MKDLRLASVTSTGNLGYSGAMSAKCWDKTKPETMFTMSRKLILPLVPKRAVAMTRPWPSLAASWLCLDK